MALLDYDYIVKYQAKVRLMGPLHIGGVLEGTESVLIHPVTACPFVQASSIAGVFRAYLAQNENESLVNELFGSADKENTSRVRFADGEFEEGVVIELRPHVMIDRQTGTVSSSKNSGQKFEMEYVGVGSEFIFTCHLFLKEKNSIGQVKAFETIFSAMKEGELIFGGKKSSGAGRTKLIDLQKKEFNCLDKDKKNNNKDLEYWLAENQTMTDVKPYESYLEKLPEIHSKRVAYRVSVTGKTEGAIQIKGIAASGFGDDAPNSENIRTAEKNYIIPGSSLRGVFRSQMEKIADYLQKPKIIQAAFGMAEDGEEQKVIKGNLFFTDTVIGDMESNDRMPFRHRIHIDKFTGGVFQKGLFSEKNAAGDLDILIEVENNIAADAVLALLVMALRDLAIQTMNIGNGYANGKGFVKDICIDIQSWEKKKAVISFEEKTPILKDNDRLLQNAFQKLKGGAY